MDRAQNLLRRILVLAVACAAFLVVLVLRSAATVEAPSEERLAPTFPAFEAAKVRALEFDRTATRDGKSVKEAVRLGRAPTGGWVLESSGGYPADAKRVDDFLKTLAGVRTRALLTTNPEKYTGFCGPDGWLNVRLFADGDAPVVSFGLGKSGAEGSYSSFFVRVDDVGGASLPAGKDAAPRARVVSATGLDAFSNRTEPTYWIESRLWPGLSEDQIQELAFDHPPKSWSSVLVRGAKGEKDTEEPWTLKAPEPVPADGALARQLCKAFAGMLITGIEEGGQAPDAAARLGFDKPELVLVARGTPGKEGLPTPEWKVVVGKKIEGKATWYARRSTNGKEEPFVVSVDDLEISRFRSDPHEFLAKKPEVPPTPGGDAAGMGEAAMDGAGPTPPPAMGEAPPSMEEAPGMADAPAMGDSPAPAMGEPPAGMGEPPAGPGMDGAAPK